MSDQAFAAMKIIRRFLPYMRPYFPGLLLSIALSASVAALSTLSIAIIWPIMRLIFGTAAVPGDTVATGIQSAKEWFIQSIESLVIVPSNALLSLRNLCLLIIWIFVLKNILKYSGSLLVTRIEEGMMKDVRDDIFQRTVKQSLRFFNARRAGELMSIVTNDVGTMNAAMTPMLATLFREPMQIILILILLVSFSPTLTLIAFSTSILSVLVVRVLTRYIRRYSTRMQGLLGDITSRLQETFQNIRIIKAYSAEPHETNRFRTETGRYVRSAMKHAATVHLMGPISEVFSIVALAVVFYYGGMQVLNGDMKADELMAFLFLLFAIMQPIVNLFTIPGSIQRGLAAGERVLTIVESAPEIIGGSKPAPALASQLRMVNVSFAYREGHPVLRDVTLTVRRGQTVALVGPSGGGKSTIVDLLVRFYDPTEGGIELDGVDIREFELGSYRSLFGIVTQESILFNDSVRNNIAYADELMEEDRVKAAARMANAHEFVARMPEGYQTTVGDRGVLLSGGQRQRLAIARALARDPQILLFDEATSALDNESEALVQEAITRLIENRTAIVIAHRLSTIRRADLILVVDDGRIVEQGSHDELMDRDGVYRRLYELSGAADPSPG